MAASCRNGHVDDVVSKLTELGNSVDIKPPTRMDIGTSLSGQGSGHNEEVAALQRLMDKLNVEERQDKFLQLCREGREDAIGYFLSRGVDVNAKGGSCGYTALMEACKSGHVGVVETLMDRDADVNVSDVYGNTALMGACRNGHEEVVQVFTQRDDVKNNNSNSKSISNNTNSVDINASYKYGNRALTHACCKHDRVKVVDIPVERVVDVNMTNVCGYTALMAACRNGHAAVVCKLMDLGDCVDVNARNDGGNTALIWACLYGYTPIVKLLLGRGDMQIEKRDLYGNTALMWACKNGHDDIVRLLLERGADQTAKNKFGFTALMKASRNAQNGVVELLLERCSATDVNTRDEDGETALMGACRCGSDMSSYETVVELLLRHGADINVQNLRHGQTAVMSAVINGKVKCLERLLSWGPDLDIVNNVYGKTVFSYAMRAKNADCLRLLLVEGKLIAGGKLKSVHRNLKDDCSGFCLEPLLLTIEMGMFEWEWCPMKHFKEVSLAALQAYYCPGRIRCEPNSMDLSPLIASLLESDDSELTQTIAKHLYYFPEDYTLLTTHNTIRERVKNKTVLDGITRRPMSLQTWSFLAVSKSISVAGPPGLRCQRVDTLPVPNLFRRRLKFVFVQ